MSNRGLAFSALLSALFSSAVAALPTCEAVFPSVLQSHEATQGQLTLTPNVKIFDEPDNTFEFLTLSETNNWQPNHCDGSECFINNTVAAKLALPTLSDPNDFPSLSIFPSKTPEWWWRVESCSSQDVDIGSFLGFWHYSNVVISGNCSATVTADTYIENLVISDNAELVINGGFTLTANNISISTNNRNNDGLFGADGAVLEVNNLTVAGNSSVGPDKNNDTFTVYGFGTFDLSAQVTFDAELFNQPFKALKLADNADFYATMGVTAEDITLANQAELIVNDRQAVKAKNLSLSGTSKIRNASNGSKQRIAVTGYGDLSLENQDNGDIEFQPHYYRDVTFGVNAGDLHWAGGNYQFRSISTNAGYPNNDFYVYGNSDWYVESGLSLAGNQHFRTDNDSYRWRVITGNTVDITDNAQFHGVLYVDGDLTMSSSAKLYGFASAENISLSTNAEAYRRDDALLEEWPDYCTPKPTSFFRAERVPLANNRAPIGISDYDLDDDPLVFVSSPTTFGDPEAQDPADVAVTRVDRNAGEVDVAVWGPPLWNGAQPQFSLTHVDVIIVSPGEQTLSSSDGSTQIKVEAGSVSGCEARGRYARFNGQCRDSVGDRVNFVTNFAAIPALLVQIQGQGNGDQSRDFLTARAENVTAARADIGVDAHEIDNRYNQLETVAWLAMEGEGEVLINGEPRLVEARNDITSHSGNAQSPSEQCDAQFDVNWRQPFTAAPLTVASKRTRTGPQGGWTRICKSSKEIVNVVIEEDQAEDSEQNHLPEQFGLVAISTDEEPISYYQIEHSGQGITCQPTLLTISAFSDSDYQTPLTESVTVTLAAPTSGWVGADVSGNQVTFTGQTTIGLWSSDTVNPVDVAISPADGGSSRCLVAGVETSACQINYTTSALLLSNETQQGCQTHEATLQAVRASDEDPSQCVAYFNDGRDILFSAEPQSPTAVAGDPKLTINGTDVPLGGAQATVAVSFDANGSATLDYQYSDVGRLAVTPTFNGTFNGEIIIINGNSAQWDLLPSGFDISSSSSCSNADSSCPAVAKAGEGVGLTVAALCTDDNGANTTAQNFIHGGFNLDTLLVAPADETNNTVITTVAFEQDDYGAVSVNAISNEVGVFRWKPESDISYLSGTISKDSYSSVPVGRFTPAYLKVTGADAELAPYCNGMSYYNQTLAFVNDSGRGVVPPKVTIQGFGADNSETKNYIGDFWLFSNSNTNVGAADAGIPVGINVAAVSPLTSNTDANAQTLQLPNAAVTYFRANGPVVPHPADLTYIINADSLTDSDGICVQTDFATSTCLDYRFEDIGGTEWRDGRMALKSVYGSETDNLMLPVTAEYYNASGRYQQNFADSCTVLGSFDVTDANGNAIGTETSLATVSSGEGSISIPTRNLVEVLTVEQRIDAESHLQWWWRRDINEDEAGRLCFIGSDPSLCNPKAQLSFGRFRGNDRVIYRRERR